MKVIVDRDIPFLEGVLEPYAQVVYIKGNEIDFSAIKDADALLVRTRTKCNRELFESGLERSSVKFVASATMGTDHIDLDYLFNQGIAFKFAPGCNAGGVMQYVFTSLYAVAQYARKPFSLEGKTLGVIGVGNTGGRVADLGEHLGFKVLRNDPPRASREGNSDSPFCSLDYLLSNSDIISMHVPLTEVTREMVSEDFFSKTKPGLIFINSSRGEVVDDNALLAAGLQALILDVWNRESSQISREVLARTDIATPHIAGYSLEGKMNGTAMVVQALARHFRIKELETFAPLAGCMPEVEFKSFSEKGIADRLLSIFPVLELDKQLRLMPEDFEKIRSEYEYRREFRYR